MKRDNLFHDFYKEKFSLIHRYLFVLMNQNDAAEEMAQEVFYMAYEKWDELQNHPNIMGWLYKTAQNLSKNYNRKSDNRVVSLEDCVEYSVPHFEENAYKDVDLLLSMSQTLDEEENQLMMWHYYGGYSIAEIAQHLGTSESNLRVRFFRIRKKMRGQFE